MCRINGSNDVSNTYEIIIDLETAGSPDSFHQLIRKLLPVPEYYGENLAALNDFLTSYFHPLYITFQNYEKALLSESGKFYLNLKRMCDAAESDSEYIKFIWK